MKVINTEKAPGAIGPYSQGFVVGNLVITSGQIPVNPADGSVGEFVRMHRRRGEDDLRHLESAVAEKRHQIDDHRNTPCGDDRVAFETVDPSVPPKRWGNGAAG